MFLSDTLIPANADFKLNLPVQVGGSVVYYKFSSAPYDLSFSATFKPLVGDTMELFPATRVPCHEEPVMGQFKITSEGVVNLIWDNSFSWMTPKALSYAVEIKQVCCFTCLLFIIGG